MSKRLQVSEMASGFPHHPSLGSSLPTDYAILEHFANHRDVSVANDSEVDDVQEEDGDGRLNSAVQRADSPEVSPSRRPQRSRERMSLNVPHYGSTAPFKRRASHGQTYDVIGTGIRRVSFSKSPGFVAPDREPLLADVPRIHEAYDTNEPETESWKIRLQELRIISRYTAPVFGYVYRANFSGMILILEKHSAPMS